MLCAYVNMYMIDVLCVQMYVVHMPFPPNIWGNMKNTNPGET